MRPFRIKAKEENSERVHFNQLYKDNSDLPPYYSIDLSNHPDHRIVKAGIKFLQGSKNEKCLLFGCGIAAESWYLSRLYGYVFGFDIAENPLKIANRASIKFGFKDNSSFMVMSGYNIGLRDESVDHIYGHAILHHLEQEKVGPELYRVLKRGGMVVFTEPFDANPFLRFARNHLPYPAKHRVPGEKALRASDIRSFSKYFDRCEFTGVEFFAMIGRLIFQYTFLKNSKLGDKFIDFLYRVDSILFKIFPFLRNMGRSVVCCFYKD